MTTSSDGVLTATASDPSVLLTADFSATAPDASYRWVTVTRSDGTVVRGLDNALAPGGQARGIDTEFPLGQTVTYTAALSNGSDTISSTSAKAISSVPESVSWLKSLLTPALSVELPVGSAPDWSDDVPTSLIYPLGSSGVVYPNVSQGARQADRGTMTVECETPDQRAAILTLLRSPGPYLLQLAQNSGEPDQYVIVGAVQRAWVVNIATEPWRTLTLPLTVVARPPTRGSRVAVPGNTYADSLAKHPTYADRTGTYWDS